MRGMPRGTDGEGAVVDRLEYIDRLVAIMAKHGVTSLVEGDLTITLPAKPQENKPQRPLTLDEVVNEKMRLDSSSIDAELIRAKLNGER
jgi:hypothetical protein